MSVRGRRVAIVLPIVVTLMLAGAVGTLIIVPGQQKADLVVQADDAGSTFLGDVSVFESSVVKAVNSSDAADPAKLVAVIERAIVDAPVLPEAPEYGVERSGPYAEARRTAATYLKPYRRLVRELRRTDVALEFIAQARSVLGLRASDYLGIGLIDSSAPVRSQLIPAFVKARDDFAAVRVPEGQQQLAATVLGAVQHVIDQGTALADSIEANRSFSFSYADQYRAAIEAVENYATVVTGDLAEAINAVTDER